MVRPGLVAAVAIVLTLSAVEALAPSGRGVIENVARAGAAPAVLRSQTLARLSPCDRPPHSALAYGWPLKPFDRQHPIRGNFGDPRTLTLAVFGADSSQSEGAFSFHNGIDIAAPVGTSVYPVVSGRVVELGQDEIVVRTADARTFQYWHLDARVRVGEEVLARSTILGTIAPEYDHVHLSEIDGFRIENPLEPGHLEPYRDHTAPEVEGLSFSTTAGKALDPMRIRGRVTIQAQASDLPPLPVAGAWFGFPVAPAVVSWQLATGKGRIVVPPTTVADFRDTEPPNSLFWHVYAPGTYQNFPVFDRRYYWHQPGRYVFALTPDGLDTTRLGNGTYRVTVVAADECGNRGSLSQTVRIVNPPARPSDHPAR
jgi:murein DD-endopeptidase MepM/ murein hydrolase activator NlpD